MNKNRLKAYASKARWDFIKAVTDRAAFYGLTKKKTEPVVMQEDVAITRGNRFRGKWRRSESGITLAIDIGVCGLNQGLPRILKILQEMSACLVVKQKS